MRMVDLNLEKIQQAHEEDQQAYKRKPCSASPQHLHRAWLLKHIAEQQKIIRQLREDNP